ncbi:hypothetical protein BB560_002084 [Smittium megazygosporum]|uniref:Uncharacterized protein n=1 Tax=Smittium megazygosporum TaxID=133381 RepID=A0A2T9ZFS5_9FUNG|nr:hypothetical protein BB560_002084 [Smittium megazygosporum]
MLLIARKIYRVGPSFVDFESINLWSNPDIQKNAIHGLKIRAKVLGSRLNGDIMTSKYAPDRSNPLELDTDIMGSTFRNTQRTRVEMLRGIGVSLSI